MRGDPPLRRRDQRRARPPGLRSRVGEDRHRPHPPRGRHPRRGLRLRLDRPRAAPGAHLALLDRHHEGRPHLLGLLPERRGADPLAHLDRPPAPLPRPRGLPRLRRAPADLQAAPGPARHPRPGRDRRRRGRRRAGAQLPDAPRQVAHPLDLRRHPAHGDALARHRADLAQRPRRGPPRGARQRLGGGAQRPRRGGHPRLRVGAASRAASASSTTPPSAPSAPRSPRPGAAAAAPTTASPGRA